jgi:hypothetical protein
MGTEIDETTMLGELTEYFTSISSVEISDIDNVYDETTTHTFDFQTVVDTYSAYSLDTVTVVFDDGE